MICGQQIKCADKEANGQNETIGYELPANFLILRDTKMNIGSLFLLLKNLSYNFKINITK